MDSDLQKLFDEYDNCIRTIQFSQNAYDKFDYDNYPNLDPTTCFYMKDEHFQSVLHFRNAAKDLRNKIIHHIQHKERSACLNYIQS